MSEPKTVLGRRSGDPFSRSDRVECAPHRTRHFAYRAAMTDVLFLLGIIAPAKSRFQRSGVGRCPPKVAAASPQAAPGEVPHPSLSTHPQSGNNKGRHRRPEDVLQHPVRCRAARVLGAVAMIPAVCGC